MKIAFVGKGGSGKTTLTALFALYAKQNYKDVLLIDADINTHLASLLGFKNIGVDKHISNPKVVSEIKNYLIGQNSKVKDVSHFFKSTPPTLESNFVVLGDKKNFVLENYSFLKDNLSFMVVGSYEEEGIGASCYHTNLIILENVLAHTVESDNLVIADMVAGVDAFANTLHAQFDVLFLVVEPTKRSLEVYDQYKKLADSAGIGENIFVIGNKIRSKSDEDFIKEHIPDSQIIGFFPESEYLRVNDQTGEVLNLERLESDNQHLLDKINTKLRKIKVNYEKKLNKLYSLHKKLTSQPHIKSRYGDLASQIDPNFEYKKITERGWSN